MIIREPWTASEFAQIYEQRWEAFVKFIPRQYLLVPDGIDELPTTHHRAAFTEEGELMGAGRLTLRDLANPAEGSISSLFTVERWRLNGLRVGANILSALESEAAMQGAYKMSFFSLAQAVPFYVNAGYALNGKEQNLYGVRHVPIVKELVTSPDRLSSSSSLPELLSQGRRRALLVP